MVTADQVRRIQQKKADILAPIVYVTMKPGDTSAEAMDIAMKYTTDQTVIELVIEHVTKLLEVDEEQPTPPDIAVIYSDEDPVAKIDSYGNLVSYDYYESIEDGDDE